MSSSLPPLPPGTRLEYYCLEQTLARGCGCITYLARDTRLGASVLIRESTPNGTYREAAPSLRLCAVPEQRQQVEECLEESLDRAHQWMDVDHPNIAKLIHCFSALGTVYEVSPCIDAPALDVYREQHGAPSAEEAQAVTTALLDALLCLHGHGLLHKDIRPAHILMQDGGRPLLTHPCLPYLNSSEEHLGDEAAYSPYTAVEQQGRRSAAACGAWTDVYALGAALHTFIAGEPPLTPFVRTCGREYDGPAPYEPLVMQEGLRERYPATLLASIDKALSLEIESRWHSARQWLDELQAEASPRLLPPGFNMGDYMIERVLGHGANGATYLAMNTWLQQRVVLKEFFPSHSTWRKLPDSPDIKARSGAEDGRALASARLAFMREARTLATLEHPNIIKVLTAFTAHGTLYYVMPYIEASSLDAFYHHHSAPSEAWLGSLLVQLLKALEYMGLRGILHLDIKPGNILLAEKGRPILIDFGASRHGQSEGGQAREFTHGYTPPELQGPQGQVGPWTDIYALGATFYTLITGNAPLDCRERRHAPDCLGEQPRLLEKYSASFLAGIDKALELEPSARWQYPGEWLHALLASPQEDGAAAQGA